jgi:hypothetical protein
MPKSPLQLTFRFSRFMFTYHVGICTRQRHPLSQILCTRLP